MEETTKFTKITQTSSDIVQKQNRIARQITDRLLSRNGSKKMSLISKKHIDRYLYTFAFEIGSDLPNDQILKTIYCLLLGSEEPTSLNEGIQEANFHLMLIVCLNLYEEAKKTPIGGIFERVIMGLKQKLYYSKLQSIAEPV